MQRATLSQKGNGQWVWPVNPCASTTTNKIPAINQNAREIGKGILKVATARLMQPHFEFFRDLLQRNL